MTSRTERLMRRFKGREQSRVLYAPPWVGNDYKNPACRHGVIHEVGEMFVYVLFQGDTRTTACEPESLVLKDTAEGEYK